MPVLSALFGLLLPLAAPLTDAQGVRTAEVNAPSIAIDDSGWDGFVPQALPDAARQVRIEQRMILRISPSPSMTRPNAFDRVVPDRPPPRLVERSAGKCIPTRLIAGVSDSGRRLVFHLRGHGMIAAALEKVCSPRDFYHGLYVEPSADGMLCVDRDRLLSRTGAKCTLSQFRTLEWIED